MFLSSSRHQLSTKTLILVNRAGRQDITNDVLVTHRQQCSRKVKSVGKDDVFCSKFKELAFKGKTQKGRQAGKSANQSSSYTLFLSVHCIRCLEKYGRMRQAYTGVFLMQSSTPQLPADQRCHLFAHYLLTDEFILMHFKYTQTFVSYSSLCQ